MMEHLAMRSLEFLMMSRSAMTLTFIKDFTPLPLPIHNIMVPRWIDEFIIFNHYLFRALSAWSWILILLNKRIIVELSNDGRSVIGLINYFCWPEILIFIASTTCRIYL